MTDTTTTAAAPSPAHLARQLECSFADFLATLALLEPAEMVCH